MKKQELRIWESRLATPKDNGKNACDFAELIWSGKVSEEQQSQLLSSPVTRVREVTAWAIADLGRDGVPMRALLKHGANDPSVRVRLMVAFALKEGAAFLTDEEREKHAAQLIDDPNPKIQVMLAPIFGRNKGA